jgi:flavin-dependent dehydrogenase
LVEKEALPRAKPCGGALSLQHLKRFKYLDNKIEEINGCPSYGVKVYSPSLETVAGYTYPEPQLLMVLREKFDQVLVDGALDSGAELRHNTVKDVTITQDTAVLTVDGGERIVSKVVVGADGVNSVVAKKTGLNSGWSKWQVALCAVNDVKVGEGIVEEYVGIERPLNVFLLNDLFGYGWLFPKKEHLNVGIGGLLSKTKNISNIYKTLVRLLKDPSPLPGLPSKRT